MGKPVNLNRYRKEKARAEKKARADQNAASFGRTKAEKDLTRKLHDLTRKNHDGREVEE